MSEMNCKNFEEILSDYLLESGPVAPSVATHLAACPSCATELQQMRATFNLLDDWTAPEPSPFFDTRLHARLREEQESEKAGFWARVAQWFQPAGKRGLRPAMAGALGLAMVLGGGTAVTLWTHHASTPAVSSPTVNDLKIYDNNAQALDQMDMLENGDAGDTPTT